MIIDSNKIIVEYDANLQIYNSLADIVMYDLAKKLKGLKIHAIEYRIKSVASLLDKIRRNKITEPFQQIHDLVGFRVVCLFLADLEIIRSKIEDLFEVFDVDDKINESEIDVFGYMSLHLKAKLKETSGHVSELTCIPFEVQVRTIAQDAWASISHHLDYKQESVIPQQLRKDFHALSGLFYVADTHFSIIKKGQASTVFRKE